MPPFRERWPDQAPGLMRDRIAAAAARTAMAEVLTALEETMAATPSMTSAMVRQLYDVEADVRVHELAGHLTVVPLGRLS